MNDKRVIVTTFNNGDDMFSDISAVTAVAKRLQAECLSLLSERDQLRAKVERLQSETVPVPRELLKEAADEIAHMGRQWCDDDAMGLRTAPPRMSRLLDKLRALLVEGDKQ